MASVPRPAAPQATALRPAPSLPDARAAGDAFAAADTYRVSAFSRPFQMLGSIPIESERESYKLKTDNQRNFSIAPVYKLDFFWATTGQSVLVQSQFDQSQDIS